MTDEQFATMSHLEEKITDIKITRDICELILNEVQEEKPTPEEEYYAYKHVQTLAKGLFDRLRNEVKEMETLYKEFEKALK